VRILTQVLCSIGLVALAVAAVSCAATPTSPRNETSVKIDLPPAPTRVSKSEVGDIQPVWECNWVGGNHCGDSGTWFCNDAPTACYTLACPAGGSPWWQPRSC
jgi:hypothetical protein